MHRLTEAEMTRYYDELDKNKFQCKNCGHKEFIYFRSKKKICSWCNHWIYRDKNLEFKENLKKRGIKI